MATKAAISSKNKSSKVKHTVKAISTESVTKPQGKTISKVDVTSLVKSLVSEFIGTFLLVAAVFAVQGQPLYVAFALAGIVLILGGASGAYVNPALTIGAWVTQKIKSVYAIGYIIAQLLGAGAAYLTLNTLLHSTEAGTASVLFHAATVTSGKEWAFFFAELIGAIILGLGLAAAVRVKKADLKSAFSYGFAVLIALLFAGWVTSTSLTEANTALSFLNPAVALAANGLSFNLWPIAIYVIAPIIGGVIGFFVQDLLKSNSSDSCCDCSCGCCDVK